MNKKKEFKKIVQLLNQYDETEDEKYYEMAQEIGRKLWLEPSSEIKIRRLMILQFHEKGMSNRRIAREMGISTSAVWNIVHRQEKRDE